jgi:hypothetical protein
MSVYIAGVEKVVVASTRWKLAVMSVVEHVQGGSGLDFERAIHTTVPMQLRA